MEVGSEGEEEEEPLLERAGEGQGAKVKKENYLPIGNNLEAGSPPPISAQERRLVRRAEQKEWQLASAQKRRENQQDKRRWDLERFVGDNRSHWIQRENQPCLDTTPDLRVVPEPAVTSNCAEPFCLTAVRAPCHHRAERRIGAAFGHRAPAPFIHHAEFGNRIVLR